jgi:hypothetical protein
MRRGLHSLDAISSQYQPQDEVLNNLSQPGEEIDNYN